MPSGAHYEQDIIAWANQQARWLRERRFDQLDLEHLAEEIEDVGKSEQRELANRMALLLAHLIKWAQQPERRGASWEITIRNQRRGILRRLEETPSLRPRLTEPQWWLGVWDDATAHAAQETGLADFPETCPWSAEQILDPLWFPTADHG
ncbi:protein of unknown function DUF29 [Allochromatium warmingii]|uniref:DUF29 domain-containing protein n=1 Tax=Allochromatium warmingii TaxID=61595 RepID=A0A1H3ENX3_ALLWA|nr:DUF29 domain-containing protein [Allochromatium warmingii]SDX80247.1 protein of unknown function DUF29 [Allochromatium warmingii]